MNEDDNMYCEGCGCFFSGSLEDVYCPKCGGTEITESEEE